VSDAARFCPRAAVCLTPDPDAGLCERAAARFIAEQQQQREAKDLAARFIAAQQQRQAPAPKYWTEDRFASTRADALRRDENSKHVLERNDIGRQVPQEPEGFLRGARFPIVSNMPAQASAAAPLHADAPAQGPDASR
jgi:hypothetical protein